MSEIEKEVRSPFTSVLVIGAAGQTGQLFTAALAKIKHIRVNALVREKQKKQKFPAGITISTSIEEALQQQPEAIILAIPNPLQETLESIAAFVKGPVTLILPQNGVDAVPTALSILEEKKIRSIQLIRASLFTTVSLGKNAEALYNSDKLRIALSPVFHNIEPQASLQKAKTLFEAAGFRLAVFRNYKSMEWTKLVVNGLGATAVITGYTPRETFRDEKLFALEVRALRERLLIMQVSGISFAAIPWQNISQLPLLQKIPTPILKAGRVLISDLVARGRENAPPAAARKISDGKPTEIRYYLQPFISLAQEHGLRSVVDEAILEIISEHEKGILNLNSLTAAEKKDLLLKTYHACMQKPFISRNPFKTSLAERLRVFFSPKLSVAGVEHLDLARESINEGKSVLLLANHQSHADHPTLVGALRQNGFADLAERLVFVAGMRVKNELMGRFFNDAYPTIQVSTPTAKVLTEEEKQQAHMINLKGFREASRLLKQGGLLVIYPEGTRSKSRQLLKAIPAVARYFQDPNVAYIIPVGLQGTGDVLPIDTFIPRFAETKVSFGQPISPASLFKTIIDALPGDKRKKYKRDRKVRDEVNEKAMDFIMKEIARLLPPDMRGNYS